ncbi:hypothetical protein EXS70_03625 [Candidatus Peribacteria bacterium]|nr:hypothetical protein [Candidatus Peribacteria bacterium]
MFESEFQALSEVEKYEAVRNTDNLTEAMRCLWFLAQGNVKDYHQTLFEFLLGDFPQAFDDNTGHWFDTDIDDCPGGTLFVGVRPEGWFREREEIWQMETASEFERDKKLLDDLRRKFHLSIEDIIRLANELPEVFDLKNDTAGRLEYRDHLQQSGNLSPAEVEELIELSFGHSIFQSIENQVQFFYLRMKSTYPPTAERLFAEANVAIAAGISSDDDVRRVLSVLKEFFGEIAFLIFDGKRFNARDV